MKSSTFRAAPLASEELGALHARRINWSQIFYTALLGVLLILLVRYVVTDQLYVRGTGKVQTGQFHVRFPDDVLLADVLVEPEEHVAEGEPLFRYVTDGAVERGTQDEMRWTQDRDEDVSALDARIARLRAERTGTAAVLADLRKRLARMRRGVYLDVYTRDELDELERRIVALEAEHAVLGGEIAALTTQRQRVFARAEVLVAGSGIEGGRADGAVQTYHSPVDGIVHDVYRLPSETVLGSERVLSIALSSADRLVVKAVFDQDDARRLRQGQSVRIEHANGEETLGRLHSLATIDETTRDIGDETADLDLNVVATILPLRPQDRQAWLRLSRLGLTVSSWRF